MLDWSNISSTTDIAIYDESGNLLDYWIESFDATAKTAVVHVYRDWVRDDTTQAQVAYGNGPSDQSVSKETVFDKESNLQGGWALNETSNSAPAYDLTSNNNDGTRDKSATADATGQVDGADSFDGSDDTVVIKDNDNIVADKNNWTVSLWVYSTSNSTQFTYAEDDDNGASLTIGLHGHETTSYDAEIAVYDAGWYAATSSDDSITLNNWHHVVGTFDSGANDMKLYIDGTQKGVYNGSLTPNTGGGTEIGRQLWGDQYYFDGTLDDVRVYDATLSSDEITAKYDTSKPTPDFFNQQAAESF